MNPISGKPYYDGETLPIDDPERRAFVEAHKDFRVTVPTGKHGIHEIVREEMTKQDALVANVMGYVLESGRFGIPGTYTALIRNGSKSGNPHERTMVMSDHQCEIADHAQLLDYAQKNAPLDHVLINGLGIGAALELLEPYVKKFTVIELSLDVIYLVLPHYREKLGDRLEVIRDAPHA